MIAREIGMNKLTRKQKQLLIDLIDGYIYPRDLINDYEKFVQIRKILDPSDKWIDNFQYGYYENPNLEKYIND